MGNGTSSIQIAFYKNMKTFTTLKNLANNLSNNISTDNSNLMGQLISDQHRYLIQKYFDNEKSVTTTTVGNMSLTLTVAPIAGATSATLTSTWTYPTCIQLVNFSDGEQRSVLFTLSSASITWSGGLTSAVTTAITAVGVQGYALPANVSKLKDFTVNVGQQKFLPTEIQTRREWDLVNFLPYNSDIPNYFFVYNGFINIFPIPSTTGYVITFNYKTRVPDLSFEDYSTGTLNTVGMVAGSTSITGLATNWLSSGRYPSGVDISEYNLFFRADPPYGDGIWYPILQFNSDTSLTLSLPVVNAPNITSATTYTIGQLPLLSEDFQDMLVYGSMMVYYNNIVHDEGRYKMNKGLYDERKVMLENYAGTKTALSIDLSTNPVQNNPNLYTFYNSSM